MKTRDYVFLALSLSAMFVALISDKRPRDFDMSIDAVKDTIYYFVNPISDKRIDVHPEISVTATVYHAVEEQCNAQPLITASGLSIRSTNTAYSHRYIAVSRDLLKYFPYGTIVSVEGTRNYDGIYIVADTMNKRFKKYIDILINPGMPIEKTKNVRIRKI